MRLPTGKRLAAYLGGFVCAAVVGLPAGASAASVQECGSYAYSDATGRMGWTYGPTSGAGIFNVTTRAVPCSTARAFVRAFDPNTEFKAGFRCSVHEAYESADVRCVAGDRVIHWQSGA